MFHSILVHLFDVYVSLAYFAYRFPGSKYDLSRAQLQPPVATLVFTTTGPRVSSLPMTELAIVHP